MLNTVTRRRQTIRRTNWGEGAKETLAPTSLQFYFT